VSWLRAKARADRWKEELLQVRHEMSWTVQTFRYYKGEWQQRQISKPNSAGYGEYAFKQIAMWQSMEVAAIQAFTKLNVDLDHPDKL
jgi:hypothetical protein